MSLELKTQNGAVSLVPQDQVNGHTTNVIIPSKEGVSTKTMVVSDSLFSPGDSLIYTGSEWIRKRVRGISLSNPTGIDTNPSGLSAYSVSSQSKLTTLRTDWSFGVTINNGVITVPEFGVYSLGISFSTTYTPTSTGNENIIQVGFFDGNGEAVLDIRNIATGGSAQGIFELGSSSTLEVRAASSTQVTISSIYVHLDLLHTQV